MHVRAFVLLATVAATTFAGAPRSARAKPPAKGAPTSSPSPSAPASPNADEQRRILHDAYEDYVHGNYAAAIDKARRIETAAGARKIIAASACFLNDREAARAAWTRLQPGPDRSFARYICARNGIDIETGRDHPDPAPPPDAAQAITLEIDTPATLLAAAQHDYTDGRWADAIAAARRADPKGRDPRALRIIGAASCKLDDKAGVMSAWRRLRAKADRQFIRFACVKSTVRLP